MEKQKNIETGTKISPKILKKRGWKKDELSYAGFEVWQNETQQLFFDSVLSVAVLITEK